MLLGAAGQIADGADVDWALTSSTLATEEDRGIADELAVVARIAASHRQLHELLPVAPDTPAQLMPDRTRWGHLDLLNILGRGSYGTVYRAWDTRLERLVALKLFHGASDPNVVMREGRMLARVRHENVVTVYGADIVDGIAGIWMELVHGRTLDQIVRADGAMEARQAASIGADVTRALAAVHNAGLLHCDIKAQNVVREHTGRVVLMDLGAGQPVPEATNDAHLSDVAGTPRYMAPELFQFGAKPTRATDTYSFGVLLYYLASAKYPVDGQSMGELKRAHIDGRVRPLDQAKDGLPAGYVALVTRALDPNPAQRPDNAAEVQAVLQQLAAPPPSPSLPRSIGLLAAVAIGVALLAFGVLRPLLTPAVPPAPEIRSIAVLPIKNLTGDVSKAYIADGFTEALISSLAKIKQLRVQSFAAVAAFRDSTDAPAETAKRLGVKLLLAGSLRMVDSQARLSVQLVDEGGAAVWGDEFGTDRSGYLGAQADIVRKLIAQLGIVLGPGEEQRLAQSALSPEAEDSYLRGLALTISAPANADKAVASFRRTTELAPTFAAAWAELALAEMFVIESGTPDRAALIDEVRSFSERAISLDPSSGRGYAARGTVEFYYDWDLDAAERTLRSGIEVAPGDGFVRQRFSILLAARGKLKEAIEVAREAQRLEPLVPFRTTTLGTLYYYAHDFDRALAEAERVLTINPGFAVAHILLGRIYSAQNHQPEALASIERALAINRNPDWLAEYARVLTLAGRRDDAAKIVQEIEGGRSTAVNADYTDSTAYLALAEGDKDRALSILEAAVEQRSTRVLFLAVDPRVDALRGDPRFAKLLTQIDHR
jgi:serine/threonine-protein kinase